MHFPHAAAYCIRCRLRREVCLCTHARAVAADLRMIVVIHEDESRKMSNTGHLAKLVLPDCSLVTHAARGRAPTELGELAKSCDVDGRPWRTILLFPGLGARELTPDYVEQLRTPDAGGPIARLRVVVPDGTWSQARRMVKRVPALAALPRVSLPAAAFFTSRVAMRPRGNPEPARVSTAEAMAAALGLLGETAAEAALYSAYDDAALRIALMRGKRPLAPHRHVLVQVAL